MTKVQSTSTSTDLNNNVKTQEVYMNKSIDQMKAEIGTIKTRNELLKELRDANAQVEALFGELDAIGDAYETIERNRQLGKPHVDEDELDDRHSQVQLDFMIALAKQRGISKQITVNHCHGYCQPGYASDDFNDEMYGAIKHEDFDKQIALSKLSHVELKKQAEARDIVRANERAKAKWNQS